jgi:hypothetical protein
MVLDKHTDETYVLASTFSRWSGLQHLLVVVGIALLRDQNYTCSFRSNASCSVFLFMKQLQRCGFTVVCRVRCTFERYT